MKPHCKSYLIFCIVEVSHTWCIKSHDINNLFTLKRIKTKKNNITSMSTYCKYIIHNQGEPWRAHFFFYGVIDNKYKATCGTPLQSSIRHPFIHPSIRPHSSFPDCCNPREGVFLAVRSDDLTKLTAFSLYSSLQARWKNHCRPVPWGPSSVCILWESRDEKVCTLPWVPPQVLHTCLDKGVCSHNSLGPFSSVFSTCHSFLLTQFKGWSDESGGGPQGVFGVEVWNVLFLPCYPIPTWTSSVNTQKKCYIPKLVMSSVSVVFCQN